MKKKIICPLMCPMINKYGFCESAMRRVERVQECPHNKLRETVSKLNTRGEKHGTRN